MRVDALHLQGWRNYGTQALTFDPSCNVIYGENAQGKTNLLEAIVYLSCGKSPRAHGDKELIGFDMQEAALLGDIFSRQREFVTDIRLFRGKRRKMTVNGVPAKNSAALSDVLHTVFFAPEDLFLIRAGAAERRRVMDLSLCQLRPRYAEALSQYSRLYEHKTRILRDSEDKPELLDLLPEFNEGLCRSGAVLVGYRARFCAVLAEYARQAHYECSGEREELTLTYQTVRTVADPLGSQADIYAALAAHMESHQAAERASKLCLSGAHKDDIEVLVNERSELRYLVPGRELILQRRDWKYLSLFPMEGRLTGVCIRGAFYPLENAVLTADYPLGVSNEFIADTAQLQCSGGCGLVVLTRDDA